MSEPIIQPSFAAGELSPFLYGRVDLAKFKVGARTMQNFFVHPHGGASNRPGTRFIDNVANNNVRHRLIPFVFRTLPAGQTYILVFGNKTMQVVMNTGASIGFVQKGNDRFEIGTPYLTEDLPLLKYVQSADTMTLTHPKYAARKLTRLQHDSWILDPISFEPTTLAPKGLKATASGTAAEIKVTAINDKTGEESLPTEEAGSSSETQGKWNWKAVAGCSNYNVYKKKGSVFGFVAQVQETSWTDDNIGPDISETPPGTRQPFGLGRFIGLTVSEGGSGYDDSPLPSGRLVDNGTTVTSVTFEVADGAIVSATPAKTGQSIGANAYVEITEGSGTGAILEPQWTDDGTGTGSSFISGVTVVEGGTGYANHPEVHSLYDGQIDYGGYKFTATVVDGEITGVDVTVGQGGWNELTQPQLTLNVTDGGGTGAVIKVQTRHDGGSKNPGCSAFFMQRQAYANSTELPQTLWFTCAGAFGNMNVSSPTKDSDAITRTLAGQQVNEIRHLVPIGASLMAMTSAAEWRCWPGPSSNALTPASCFTLPQSTHGCSHVPPIVAGSDLLFVQEKGSRVRSLRFDAIQDQYQSFDMSVLSSHLLHDTTGVHRIEEWAYAAEPYQIVWAVRDDGVLLGFTYMREHDVYAWHRHVTDGAVESVATVTEPDGTGGYEDAVYLIVARSLHGGTKRYVERMASRTFPTIADAWFLDCALKYDGAPVTSVSGLEHLQGRTVSILADGNVVPSQVVSGGTVTLDAACSKVIVGLPYTADLETLNLELATQFGPTAQGQMKKIARVTVRAKDSRGIQVGLNQGRSTGSGQAALQEVKQRSRERLGTAMQPFEGDWDVTIPSEWNRDGRVFVRQSYPLPATVLDLIPEVELGR